MLGLVAGRDFTRPFLDWTIVAEARHNPDFDNLSFEPWDVVRVLSRVEWRMKDRVINGHIARTNVDLTDRLPINRHPQTLFLGELLVVSLALAVQAAAVVPLEAGLVAHVEDPDVASVCPSAQLEPVEELVQSSDLILPELRPGRLLELHRLAADLLEPLVPGRLGSQL